jgi:hypothetical protein
MAASDNKVSIDEVVAAAAAGVLRALDARSAAGKQSSDIGVTDLIRSGFVVDVIIRAGGIPHPLLAMEVFEHLDPCPYVRPTLRRASPETSPRALEP